MGLIPIPSFYLFRGYSLLHVKGLLYGGRRGFGSPHPEMPV